MYTPVYNAQPTNLKEDNMTPEENPSVVVEYITARTNRSYLLTFSPVSLYAGTYLLDNILDSLQKTVDTELNFDHTITDYDPNELDYDAQEIVTFSMHYLSTHNRELKSIKKLY